MQDPNYEALMAQGDGNGAISDDHQENIQYYLDEGFPLHLAEEFAEQDRVQVG